MAHLEQAYFCEQVRSKFPRYFYNTAVLDIGSLDINGGNRQLFSNCLYIGVDLSIGKNVDFASPGHEIGLPDSSFDVVISTEVFEHDMHYSKTLNNIVRMLKPGGLFLFTCATTGRPEHGTRATTQHDAPFLEEAGWGDYYKNLTEDDIRQVLSIETFFKDFAFEINEKTHDLYFWGIKQGEVHFRDDYSFLLWESRIERDAIAKEIENLELKIQLSQKDDELKSRQEQINSLLAQNQITSENEATKGSSAVTKNEFISNFFQDQVRNSFIPFREELGFKQKILRKFKYLENRKLQKELAIIKKSIFFDSDWYLSAYSDVEQAGANPYIHFIQFGAKEGRNPSPLFDTNYYLDEYPDVAKSRINPLVHFLLFGLRENRKPNPIFIPLVQDENQGIRLTDEYCQSYNNWIFISGNWNIPTGLPTSKSEITAIGQILKSLALDD